MEIVAVRDAPPAGPPAGNPRGRAYKEFVIDAGGGRDEYTAEQRARRGAKIKGGRYGIYGPMIEEIDDL